MTKSYVVDPATGKLLTAQEWKEKAGDKVTDVKLIAIVPDDGSPAFVMPLQVFEIMNWNNAMKFAGKYKAPHGVKGSDGVFSLPSRKQAIDIRMAREDGLEQMLKLVGADGLLSELRCQYSWTREKYRPYGLEEGEDYVSGLAWVYYGDGMSDHLGFASTLAVRPVMSLKPLPSLPSNLDEAADRFAIIYDQGTCDGIAQDCFKAGAEWMAGQGETIDGEVVKDINNNLAITAKGFSGKEAVFGDKVIVQIRKKH